MTSSPRSGEPVGAPAAGSPFVQTVLGRIEPAALGQTLMHEHLVTDVAYALGLEPRQIESAQAVEHAVTSLRAAAEHGLSSFVDVGTQVFGPAPLFLLCVAQRAPVHVVSSIGAFTTEQLPAPWWVYPPATPETVAEQLTWLARHGPHGSGVLPGIIKVATGGNGIAAAEETLLRGAALAQLETGLAITTHTQLTRYADEQINILEDAGAHLDRVVIGHIGWGSGAGDHELHLRLASRGVNLGLDVVDSPARTVSEYAEIVADLVSGGYAEQLVLGHDRTAVSRGLAGIFEGDWLSPDFTPVHRELIPELARVGIDDSTIALLLSKNPRRILTIDPERYPGAAAASGPVEHSNVLPFAYPAPPGAPRG